MARIRTIKPTFFTSLTIAGLTPEQRLTFIGLWTHVDDDGRCIYDPRLLKAALWPLDDRTAEDVADDVRVLSEHSLITHYVVDDRSYLMVDGWAEHQRINRPVESKLPAPSAATIRPLTSGNESSRRTHGALTENSPQEGKGREGKGREAEPDGSGRERPQLRPVPDEPRNAGQIIALWLEGLTRRPPSSVVGQISRQVKALLEDGFTEQEIVDGLQAWQAKNLHPSTLPSVVNELINRPAGGGRGGQRVKQVEWAPNQWREVHPDEVCDGKRTRWVTA